MSMELPLVSVIIPTRNEEAHIGQTLDSVLNNDYPRERLEVIVVDGMSEDRTREIVERYSLKHKFIRFLENPLRITPAALNVAIKHAAGEIIMRMDAHCSYFPDYISKCVTHLRQGNADNVGGICITISGTESLMAKTIALVLSSRFGVGNSHFRVGVDTPKYVDTVPFGCYEKRVFEDVGLFDEGLVRNQDIEFNSRLRKSGGKVLLVPEIKSCYYARSTLQKLCSQNWGNGVWNIRLTKKMPGSLSARHFIPMFFVLGMLGGLLLSIFSGLGLALLALVFGSYLLASLAFSVKIGLREGLKYTPILPLVFFSLHSSYGLGMLWGVFTSWKSFEKK